MKQDIWRQLYQKKRTVIIVCVSKSSFLSFYYNNMGCNYYIETNKCDCCERSDQLHIAKISLGRDATFRERQGHDYATAFENILPITSIERLKKITKKYKIVNEYGEYVDYKEFRNLVNQKRKDHPYKHKLYGYDRYDDGGNYWLQGDFS